MYGVLVFVHTKTIGETVIILEPQIESELTMLAADEGVSISALIQEFIIEFQCEKEAIKRADKSYSEYKRTGDTISLEQLMRNNNVVN